MAINKIPISILKGLNTRAGTYNDSVKIMKKHQNKADNNFFYLVACNHTACRKNACKVIHESF